MRVFLRTFGCRANSYDSEAVRAMLSSAGCEFVQDPAEADVALFNSCAVTSEAEADLRQQIRRTARVQPGVRTVVMGCAAQRSPQEISQLPSVEAMVAGSDLDALAALFDVPAPAHVRTVAQTNSRAVLRIQDGCDEHCTFCATTMARGTSRSRSVEELVQEAAALAERHREIVLTGIHIGHYGRDTGGSLGRLMEVLLHNVASTRFRLSSLEATEVDATMRALLRDSAAQLVPHLHAPLQSGSDAVLRRMGRHWYRANTYAAAVEDLVADRPIFALGADIICGFPGESREDHKCTLDLVRQLPFTYLHVFPYSERPGTAAVRLDGAVPSALISERCAELRELGARKESRYRASRVGTEAEVVVTGSGGARTGLTEDYLKVQLSNPATPRGELVRATLRLEGRSLIADVHAPAPKNAR